MDDATKQRLRDIAAASESRLDLILMALASSPWTLVGFIGWNVAVFVFGFWMAR